MLDPSLMRTLLVVAEEGNFTAVANLLGCTQQAVSAQMRRLEDSVGRKLLKRTGQGVVLTADGTVMVTYARQFADISDQVRRHFATFKTAGCVKVGVPEGFASVGLQSLLAAVREVHPIIELFVECAPTERLLTRFEHDRIDLMIGLQPIGGHHGEVLWTDRFQWFGVTEAFADHDIPVRLVVPPEPHLQRILATDVLIKAGRPYVVLFESENRTSLRAAALAGLGLAVFCESSLELDPSRHVSNLPALPSVEVFIRAKPEPNGLVEFFVELFKSHGKRLVQQHPFYVV